MASPAHEVGHRIFQKEWGLAPKAAAGLGIRFPRCFGATEMPTDVTETRVVERRVDTVLRYESEAGPFLLAIESQSRRDPDKPASWAYCTSYLWSAFKLPTCLMVVCRDRATARWAQRAVTNGPEFMPTLTLQPLVLGPHNVPVITDPKVMRGDLKMDALSVITHPDESDIDAILEAFPAALKDVPEDEALPIIEYVSEALSEKRSPAHLEESVASGPFLLQVADRRGAPGRGA